MPSPRFSELSAAERAATLSDPGTLRVLSADGASSIVTAAARLDGRPILLALTDGRQRGGTIGLAEARQLGELLARAEQRRSALVIAWDTGGVRVQEGPAALGGASALGVRLARLALGGTRVVTLVSGPRGCFGAPSVIAATGHATLLVRDAAWGLTGPRLLEDGEAHADEARAVMTAAARCHAGHADALVDDAPPAIRAGLIGALGRRLSRVSAARALARGVAITAALRAQLDPPEPAGEPASQRRRDFFSYSFRGAWKTLAPSLRMGLVHAAWGELRGVRTLGIILGPERSPHGLGVADAHAVLRAVHEAVTTAPRAPIVTFLFCRGHASDLRQERAGLPRALAECLRGLVAARLAGHPLISVLGGGADGAADRAIAAPSQRVLARRGTAVAPMAPRVLAAFTALREIRATAASSDDLAALVPNVRLVDSVVRLPRALADELRAAQALAEPVSARLALPADS
ncbi:MAG: biotin-independent malonate decarboxylase subunit gamma [Deltaproteobacteria bacterium]|nr:biotin-independent malonate decarboxylase subunit gamma [Deltaproteobacteria bacterium]